MASQGIDVSTANPGDFGGEESTSAPSKAGWTPGCKKEYGAWDHPNS